MLNHVLGIIFADKYAYTAKFCSLTAIVLKDKRQQPEKIKLEKMMNKTITTLFAMLVFWIPVVCSAAETSGASSSCLSEPNVTRALEKGGKLWSFEISKYCLLEWHFAEHAVGEQVDLTDQKVVLLMTIPEFRRCQLDQLDYEIPDGKQEGLMPSFPKGMSGYHKCNRITFSGEIHPDLNPRSSLEDRVGNSGHLIEENRSHEVYFGSKEREMYIYNSLSKKSFSVYCYKNESTCILVGFLRPAEIFYHVFVPKKVFHDGRKST